MHQTGKGAPFDGAGKTVQLTLSNELQLMPVFIATPNKAELSCSWTLTTMCIQLASLVYHTDMLHNTENSDIVYFRTANHKKNL